MLLQTSPMFNSYSLWPGGQTLKRQTWYIWSLWWLDEIAHTPKPVFHLPVYCFIQSWWLCSICFHNIRPQHISIGGGCIHLRPASLARPWESQATAIAVCVWMTRPVSHSALRAASFPPCLIVAPMELNCRLLRSWRDSLLHFPCQKKGRGETKNRGEKINSSLNKFVKAAWKGVQHLLCHSCQAALTLGMLGFTWQIAREPAEEEPISFV